MQNLNNLLLEGNLVKDPETKLTPKGTQLCTFSVASNKWFKQGDEFVQEVSFFDVETWARMAELCAKELKKGRGVRIRGRIKQDRWEGKDGKVKSRVKIIADHVEFKPLFKKEDSPDKTEQFLQAV
jgi:single-strand DNA-binding protein